MEDKIGTERRRKFLQIPEILEVKSQREQFFVNLRKQNRSKKIHNKRKAKLSALQSTENEHVDVYSEIQNLFKYFGGWETTNQFDYICYCFLEWQASDDLIQIYTLLRNITAYNDNFSEFSNKLTHSVMVHKYLKDFTQNNEHNLSLQIVCFL